MELTARKELRLDQLDAEVRALPGLPPLAGLSARGPLDASGDTVLTLHLDDALLTADQRRAIAEVVAAHIPDPEWALSDDRRVLRQLLAQPAADLTLLDLAQGVQALARLLEREAMS
jgi:hypothetical protein